MIVIVDYGLGNISNVKRAIEHLGYEVVVSNTSKIIDQAETIILPGVGHFKDAMSEIKRLNLNAILAKNTDKKMIGICLGMQLMYEHSDEGDASGLGFIPGNISRIQTEYPVPHLGWNNLVSKHPMLNQDVYFVHSYQAPMSENVIAYAQYGLIFRQLFNLTIILVFNSILKKAVHMGYKFCVRQYKGDL